MEILDIHSRSLENRLLKCPNCGQNMIKKTLINVMNVEEYVKFLLIYCREFHGYYKIFH